jgi:hypothetical protein
VEGLSFYRTIQHQVAAADPDVDAAIIEFYTSEPESITADGRDEVLAAINGIAEDLLLEDGDLVTSF